MKMKRQVACKIPPLCVIHIKYMKVYLYTKLNLKKNFFHDIVIIFF